MTYFRLSKSLIMFIEDETYIQMLHYINPLQVQSVELFAEIKANNHDHNPFWMKDKWFWVRLDKCPQTLSARLICGHNINLIIMKQFLKLGSFGSRVLLSCLVQLASCHSVDLLLGWQTEFWLLSRRRKNVSGTPDVFLNKHYLN